MYIERNRPRFVLVDPSFDGKTGDKLQYALAFLESSRRNNYDFVLLASKKSPLIAETTNFIVDQRNIFDVNFYGHGTVANRHSSSPNRRLLDLADARCDKQISEIDSKIRALRESG